MDVLNGKSEIVVDNAAGKNGDIIDRYITIVFRRIIGMWQLWSHGVGLGLNYLTELVTMIVMYKYLGL